MEMQRVDLIGTYAAGSIFGFKGLRNAGKAGAQAAKKGAQKAGQGLDEFLLYHPKLN